MRKDSSFYLCACAWIYIYIYIYMYICVCVCVRVCMESTWNITFLTFILNTCFCVNVYNWSLVDTIWSLFSSKTSKPETLDFVVDRVDFIAFVLFYSLHCLLPEILRFWSYNLNFTKPNYRNELSAMISTPSTSFHVTSIFNPTVFSFPL